jgi:hypothetical protein
VVQRREDHRPLQGNLCPRALASLAIRAWQVVSSL